MFDYDYVVIGSGFGGSVAALRLTEKGYKVLVLEKGKNLTAKDFPKSNWQLKRWLWLPFFRFFGLFNLTYFRHVAIIHGVGVGGGSLVYANTLPIPKTPFYTSGTWAKLADWEEVLKPFYEKAKKMLGATSSPRLETGDLVLQDIAKDLGLEEHFQRTDVAVYFGETGKTVADPYFDGKGPTRTGCNFCGSCMLGCRHNAKNTLDKNYLHLAKGLGLTIQATSEVVDVVPIDGGGYRIHWRSSTEMFNKQKGSYTSKGVVFAGGVLGTMPLLLKLKEKSLSKLSPVLGRMVRTNSESLIAVTSTDRDKAFSDGIAIGSILHTDEHTHLEPVRYPAGAGFWRLLLGPLVEGSNPISRMMRLLGDLLRHPVKNFRVYFVDDWAKRSQILLFMQTINTTLRFTRGPFGMKSTLDSGEAPTAFIPKSIELAKRFASKVNGKPTVLYSESFLGIPTTAHILGGAPMGENPEEGVIDGENRVFGYDNMYICDGSMISANPGVNPSLTITAISEHAMSKIPSKHES